MLFSPQKIKMLKVEEISPNPYQTRRNFNINKLQKLAESIKEVGILSPLIVRITAGGYELICGQRRLRAAILIGMKSVPVILVRAGDKQCAQLSMIENMQRENLALFEESEGFYNLMSYHKTKKEELSKNLSVEISIINEKVSLLSMNPPVRYSIEENGITEDCARELLKLRDENLQLELLDKIIKKEINPNEVPDMVKEKIREISRKNSKKKGRKKIFDLSLYVNTVKKTAELLRKNGAKVDLEQTEDEKSIEFTLKITKSS